MLRHLPKGSPVTATVSLATPAEPQAANPAAEAAEMRGR